MAKTITVRPATIDRFTAVPINSFRKRRVAGYARVSTEQEEQQSSYEAQMKYYKQYIESRSDWEFVDMYSDEGISGTNTKKREGFKRMIADALDGKIDLIVTKSVSRFARNTLDSITTIRQLKEKGVEVYFEKENIWTLDSKGELLITIMSSLAQEESRSISENTTWGKRKMFAEGKCSLGYGRFLGYDRGPNGGLVVNPEQAEVVKLIYKLFLEGYSYKKICNELIDKGIPTPGGKKNWVICTVKNILTNEKYKGDALLQKKFTVDFMTKKQVPNQGQVPQYYVEGDHEAIIAPATFDAVQAEIARRSERRMVSNYIFSSRIKCGECGGWYGSKVWHSTDKYRRQVFQCNRKFDNGCKTPVITDAEARRVFVAAFNKLADIKDEVIANLETMLTDENAINATKVRAAEVEKEMARLSEEVEKLVLRNATEKLDQTTYNEAYSSMYAQHSKLKEEYESLTAEIENHINYRNTGRVFLDDLKLADGLLKEFDETLWGRLVDYIIVRGKNDMGVVFKNGMEIKA